MIFSNHQKYARFNTARLQSRNVDEVLGICRGLLADGAVNISEAIFLKDWIERHQDVLKVAPYDALYARLADALSDGVLDSDEENDLLAALSSFVGGEFRAPTGEPQSLSSLSPLDNPMPTIGFQERLFVVTGTFRFGPRKDVHNAITTRGAKIAASPNRKTNFLVMGEIGSADWAHSSFGRKVEAAMRLRTEGLPLAIVSEAHWVASLS